MPLALCRALSCVRMFEVQLSFHDVKEGHTGFIPASSENFSESKTPAFNFSMTLWPTLILFHDVVTRGGGVSPGFILGADKLLHDIVTGAHRFVLRAAQLFHDIVTLTLFHYIVTRGGGVSHKFHSQGSSTFPQHSDPPPLTTSRCAQTDGYRLLYLKIEQQHRLWPGVRLGQAEATGHRLPAWFLHLRWFASVPPSRSCARTPAGK